MHPHAMEIIEIIAKGNRYFLLQRKVSYVMACGEHPGADHQQDFSRR
jgi:hypothetical protein